MKLKTMLVPLAVIVVMSVGGCSASKGTGGSTFSPATSTIQAQAESPSAAPLSQECRYAVEQALSDEQELYNSHPLWVTEMPGVNASVAEKAAYDALIADEEAQWIVAYTPIYSSCSSPAEWWSAANEYPEIAGVTRADALDPESLTVWCSDFEGQPACTGISEWLAEGSS